MQPLNQQEGNDRMQSRSMNNRQSQRARITDTQIDPDLTLNDLLRQKMGLVEL